MSSGCFGKKASSPPRAIEREHQPEIVQDSKRRAYLLQKLGSVKHVVAPSEELLINFR